MAQSLELHRTATVPDSAEMHRKFVDRRSRLNGHVKALHQRREPWGLSAYQIQGQLLRLPEGVQTSIRWSEKTLERFTTERVELVRDTLRELAGFRPFFRPGHPSPWASAMAAR